MSLRALVGRKAPSWSVLERIVKILGGDADHYRSLWVKARDDTQGEAPRGAAREEA
jgi:hypothetical protein